jgi:hypothetical protein
MTDKPKIPHPLSLIAWKGNAHEEIKALVRAHPGYKKWVRGTGLWNLTKSDVCYAMDTLDIMSQGKAIIKREADKTAAARAARAAAKQAAKEAAATEAGARRETKKAKTRARADARAEAKKARAEAKAAAEAKAEAKPNGAGNEALDKAIDITRGEYAAAMELVAETKTNYLVALMARQK